MSTEPACAIEVYHLSYSYRQQLALGDVTFSVPAKSINGFVGPNGSGKTTTLKILATLLKPGTGNVSVFGFDVVSEYKEVRKRIGFMPDHLGMYRQMTVFEYLDFFAAAYGLGLGERDRIIGDVLELTDMGGRRDSFIKELSRGMQQRVSLARVLVNDPDLLLLDEPTAGLDPRARIELMEILQELQRMGKTIFISSHILSELGDLCDSFTIIDQGVTKYTGPRSGLLLHSGETATYVVDLAEDSPAAAEAMAALPGIESVYKEDSGPRYHLAFERAGTELNAVLNALLEAGAQVVAFQPEAAELRKAFMDLTKPGVRS